MYKLIVPLVILSGCIPVEPVFEPEAQEALIVNAPEPPPPAMCEEDIDCITDEPCVSRSMCNPGDEFADARGCAHIYFVRGDACGGSDTLNTNWGSCQYTTESHNVGNPVACVSEI